MRGRIRERCWSDGVLDLAGSGWECGTVGEAVMDQSDHPVLRGLGSTGTVVGARRTVRVGGGRWDLMGGWIWGRYWSDGGWDLPGSGLGFGAAGEATMDQDDLPDLRGLGAPVELLGASTSG